MFKNLNVPNANEVKAEKDVVGGTSYILDSGIYEAEIEQAYGTESNSGALGVVMKFKIFKPNNETSTLNHTFWISNKEKQVTYTDKNGEKHFLAGYNQVNAITEGLLNLSLNAINPETRTIPLYNFNTKKEEPTPVQAIPALFGKKIALCILKTLENKTSKDNSGKYVPIAETMNRNDIDKVLLITRDGYFTATELKAGKTEPDFASKWLEKNKDVVRDKTVKVEAAASPFQSSEMKVG